MSRTRVSFACGVGWMAVAVLASSCTGEVVSPPEAESDASTAPPTDAATSDGDAGTEPATDAGREPPPDAGREGEPQTLSERYPNDAWDRTDPAIIFASDLESGAAGLDLGSYTGDTAEVTTDPALAHEGNGALELSFTLTGLESRGAASARASVRFPLPSGGEYYVRYYMRYTDGTARPHHGNNTRVYATGSDQGGTAGIRPNGDERFNTTIDIDGMGRQFFYTYWHEMRSGRCNDGTAVPGCEGDQGTTYYYGNRFAPADQTVVDRHRWACYEYRIRANTPNQYDGAQTLWTDDALVGTFEMGTPLGEWLRDNFYTMGEWGTDPSTPFEGFNFRTSDAVDQVRVTFEIYQEWNTLSSRRDDTPVKSEEQATFYDDIVIATERIGCRVAE